VNDLLAPSRTDAEAIVDLLREVNTALRGELMIRARALGLPTFSRRLPMMAGIVDHPGITVNELARRVDMPKSQVSLLVGRLQHEGIVRKLGDPNDRRLVRLFPTEEGLLQGARWREAYRAALLGSVQSLAPQETMDLLHGLRALRDALTLADRKAGETDAGASEANPSEAPSEPREPEPRGVG
jgi:DNA-binding MarR family transcriptional regulator